jgi:hypothetical protein
MVDIHVGTRVTHDGRLFVVRGVSPMSASPRRVLLEDIETHALVEADAADVTPVPEGDALGSSG